MSKFKNIILTAANKFYVTDREGNKQEIVLVDNCHFGRNMQAILKILEDTGISVKACNDQSTLGQGFIDESGNYHDRVNALKIVKSSGQLFNPEYVLGGGDELDSSCIRHFSNECILKDKY